VDDQSLGGIGQAGHFERCVHDTADEGQRDQQQADENQAAERTGTKERHLAILPAPRVAAPGVDRDLPCLAGRAVMSTWTPATLTPR